MSSSVRDWQRPQNPWTVETYDREPGEVGSNVDACRSRHDDDGRGPDEPESTAYDECANRRDAPMRIVMMMKFALPCSLVLVSCVNTTCLAQSTGQVLSGQSTPRPRFGQPAAKRLNGAVYSTSLPFDPLLGAPSIDAPALVDQPDISAFDPLLAAPSDYLDSRPSVSAGASGIAPAAHGATTEHGGSADAAEGYAATPTERTLLEIAVDRGNTGRLADGVRTPLMVQSQTKAQHWDPTTQSMEAGSDISAQAASPVTSGVAHGGSPAADTQIYRLPW